MSAARNGRARATTALAALCVALAACGGSDTASPSAVAPASTPTTAATPSRPAPPTATPEQLLARVTGYRLVDDAELTADVRAELGEQPNTKALAVRGLMSRRGDYVGFVHVSQLMRAAPPNELGVERTEAVAYGFEVGDADEVQLGDIAAVEISFSDGNFRKRWYIPSEYYWVTVTGKDAVATDVARQLAAAISQAS